MKKCIVGDCQAQARGRFNMCEKHVSRLENGIIDQDGTYLRRFKERRTGKTCIKDCGAKPKVAGMCNHHYNQSRLSNLVDADVQVGTVIKQILPKEIEIDGIKYIQANGALPLTDELIARVLQHLSEIDYTETL
jgi:hypothetical protein